MGKILILFSPALAAHLSKDGASRRSPEIQSDSRQRDMPLETFRQNEPRLLSRSSNKEKTGIEDNTYRQYLLPALLGFGVAAGIGIFYARKPSILYHAQSHVSIPPSLIYTLSASNILCAGAILYTHQQKPKDAVKVQRDLFNAWEEEAKRSAKGRTLALAEHYEAQLEALQKEHKSAQTDIERQGHDLHISQTVAMTVLSDAQSSIQKAERRVWKAANDARDIVRRMKERVRKLETEQDALKTQIRRLEERTRP